jgi:hypothetical protein
MSYSINDNYTLLDYKKLFQNVNESMNGIDSKVNFLNNNYTINDVNDCKNKLKNILNNKSGSNVMNNTKFVTKGEELLLQNLMGNINTNNTDNTNNVYVKPIQKDDLNTIEKNIYDNIINIDTKYVTESYIDENSKILKRNNYTVTLTEKIENVVELVLNTLQIPYTFYNISENLKNNYFNIYKYDGVEYTKINIKIDDGHYINVSDILDQINLNSNLPTDLSFTSNDLSKKIAIENTSGSNIYYIEFYQSNNNDIQIQSSLGWRLGCRNIEETPDFINTENNKSLLKEVNTNEKITLEGVVLVPNPNYFIFSVDDLSKSQNDKSLIEINNVKDIINPKKYPIDEKINNMNCITQDNMNNITGNYTKATRYSQIEILKQKNNMNTNNFLNNNLNVSNILAIIPFNPSDSDTKFNKIISYSFNNETKHSRKYFGPIDMEKIKFTLYDDSGNVVDFNGCNWNFSLIAKSLYKF